MCVCVCVCVFCLEASTLCATPPPLYFMAKRLVLKQQAFVVLSVLYSNKLILILILILSKNRGWRPNKQGEIQYLLEMDGGWGLGGGGRGVWCGGGCGGPVQPL